MPTIGLPALHFLVIPAPHLGAWSKVSDGVTVQFHSKFWGKSLEEEGQQSRDTSWFAVRGRGVQCGEVSKVQDGVPGDMVDDGDNLDMDENDDLAAGCRILDIGIGDIGKILIRAEYMRIYDHLEHQLATTTTNPGAVLTGQPGIGEFSYITVVLVSLILYPTRQEPLDILCPTAVPCRKKASNLALSRLRLSVCS
jgi:hypothetical protein